MFINNIFLINLNKMRRNIFFLVVVGVLLLSFPFISASWFSDLFHKNKLTGKVIGTNECSFTNPKDLVGNGILVSKYYYGSDYTLYAGKYCEKVKACTGVKNVVVVDDGTKACRCDNTWGCNGESCVTNVNLSSYWERVGSLTCTGCPSTTCGGVSSPVTCTNQCTLGTKQCYYNTQYKNCITGSDGCTTWSDPTNCPKDYSCSGGNCIFNCTDMCTYGTKQCYMGGNQTQTCVVALSGCNAWNTASNCPSGYSCSSGNCVVYCSPSCSSGHICSFGKCVVVSSICGDGKCSSNETCSSCPQDCGVCNSPYNPVCTFNSQCPINQQCKNGTCVTCTPNCQNKKCGDDGCGGSCGTCPSGYTCSGNGVCQQNAEFWTNWLDVDNPSSGGGDYELLTDYRINSKACKNPIDIQCQTTSGVDYSQAGQVVTCNTKVGFFCKNIDNERRSFSFSSCYDYRVKFKCPSTTTL
jgi:hypothetical protein